MYADDLIITCTSVEDIKEFKQKMMKEFKMIDLGYSRTTLVLKYTKGKIASY